MEAREAEDMQLPTLLKTSAPCYPESTLTPHHKGEAAVKGSKVNRATADIKHKGSLIAPRSQSKTVVQTDHHPARYPAQGTRLFSEDDSVSSAETVGAHGHHGRELAL